MRRKNIILFILVFIASQSLTAQTVKTFSPEESCRELGAILSWDPFFHSGVFTAEDYRLAFYSGDTGEQGHVLLNGEELIPVTLPYLTENGALRFPENFITPVKHAFSRYVEAEKSRYRIAAIIIDPGHGGKDSGAIGNLVINGNKVSFVEKDIALNVSKGLHSLLTAAYPDKKVLLTRSTDIYLALDERTSMANAVSLRKNEAIIYISIHANASLTASARGYEIWYLPPESRRTLISQEQFDDSPELFPIVNAMLEEEFTRESVRMARFILNRFAEVLGPGVPSRGLKANDWYVIKNVRMPSILVELGFVSNVEDARLMSGSYLKKYSEALYKGIVDFVREFELSGGYIDP